MSPRTPDSTRAVRTRIAAAARPVTSGKSTGSLSMASAVPLITSGVVVAVLALALALTWVTLTQTAVAGAHERVERSTRQLKVLVDNSVRTQQRRFATVAEDAAVLRLLKSPPTQGRAGGDTPDSATLAAAEVALKTLATPNDTNPTIELWTADGRLVHAVGEPQRATGVTRGREPELAPDAKLPPSRFGLASIDPTGGSVLSTLSECEGRACYWTVQPVAEQGRLIGLIAFFRHIATNQNSERALRELGGGSMRLYYGNADGTLATTVFGALADFPRPAGDGLRFRPRVGNVVYAEYPIEGAPFNISAELPVDDVLAPARAALRRLAGASAVLMLLGAAVAWIFGRRLATPLVELTGAAERVAGGHYDVRVTARGTQEVESLAASFNNMAEQVGASLAEVEAASRAKTDFLATMSHELRTPLNAIGGYVELMEMELRGPITELQRHDLSRIRQSQEHLLSLISAVLDLSRFERGQVSYELTTLPVQRFLAGLDALVAPQAAAKRLTLVHEPGDAALAVVADREKLRQVMLNLLSNAIRYTPAGGTISLGARAIDADTVAIHVRDTGPGIPLARQEEIFEPFVQLDRTLTQSREGVGLGLAISRDLARGMAGGLFVESEPGAGACFIVELPRGDLDDAAGFMTTAEAKVPITAAPHA